MKLPLAVAGLLLVLAASSNAAQAQVLFSDCAGGSTFKVCASAQSWYEAGTGTLFFNVVNLNRSTGTASKASDYASATGGWHTITAIGLENLQRDVDYGVGASGLSLTLRYWNGSSFRLIDPTYWAVDARTLQIRNTGASTSGHRQGLVGGWDPGPGSAEHLQTTDGRYAQFAITGFTGFAFNRETLFEWHSQQVAYQDCTGMSSSQCLYGNSLKGSTPPTDVVPEPVSMVLLGSGLAGVGALRARSRRNVTSGKSATE